MIYVRHYFPAINLEECSDEDFAMLVNDAEWMHVQQCKLLASIFGGAPS